MAYLGCGELLERARGRYDEEKIAVAGHVADSFDRRRVVAICQVISALAGLALAFGTVGGWLGRFEIFGLVALLSMARAFE